MLSVLYYPLCYNHLSPYDAITICPLIVDDEESAEVDFIELLNKVPDSPVKKRNDETKKPTEKQANSDV